MLSNFTLALFTLTLSAFFGSTTAHDYYRDNQLLPQEDTSVATAGQGPGDNYLASFLIANNSDSGTSSQTSFKRSHGMRRRNTPEGGSGKVCDRFSIQSTGGASFFLCKPKGIVVPLFKNSQRRRYIGEIRVGEDKFQKKFDVVFGTAAFDLAVFSALPASIDDKKSKKGPKHRYAKVLSGSIKVNLFDGVGTGVPCRDTVEVGGISQKQQIIATLQTSEGFPSRYGCASFFAFFFLVFLERNPIVAAFFPWCTRTITNNPSSSNP